MFNFPLNWLVVDIILNLQEILNIGNSEGMDFFELLMFDFDYDLIMISFYTLSVVTKLSFIPDSLFEYHS